MYVVKAGWTGQTFALAKSNESEGRKSRIRRSKEDRKTMVESFIKKYQSSNNGDFPSMNLTQKEVGGSYYTVREIVREVIQENRVLGPAKLTPEEQHLQNADNFLEQYPLGSIAYEPQIPFSSSPNGTDLVSDHQTTDGEMVAATNELSYVNEDQGLTNGRIINGRQIDMKAEKASNMRCIENHVSEPPEPTLSFEGETVASNMKVNLLVSEPSYAKESLEDEINASKGKLTLLVSEPSDPNESLQEEMVASETKVSLQVSEPSDAVEGFKEEMVPSETKVSLQVSEPSDAKERFKEEMGASEAKASLLVSKPPATKESLGEEMIASEAKVTLLVNGPSEPKENFEKELAASNAKVKVDPLSADVFVETFPIRPITKSTDNLGARSREGRDATRTLEKTEVRTELRPRGGSSMNSVDNSRLSGKDDVEKNQVASLENSNGTTTKEDAVHQRRIAAEVETIKAPNGTPTKYPNGGSESISKEAQPSGNTKKEGTPTLNRINLKSWEDPSRTPEKNPLVSIFRSFMTAFMKLWSD